jgi:hypothetical protein
MRLPVTDDAVLAAGYKFSFLVRWLDRLLCASTAAANNAPAP